MIKNSFSTLLKNSPLIITPSAWNKFKYILDKDSTKHSFLFSANGGGCNGFNYNIETIKEDKYLKLMSDKLKPVVMEENNTKLIIEPLSEMLLLGTTIDYIKEDYSKNIFESKFTFTPQKNKATTCGCGISFSPIE